MITIPSLSGCSVAIFGLGRSGLSSARALKNSGATVFVWDDNEAGREQARACGFAPVDLYTFDWRRLDALALSPGIPLTHPETHPIVLLARQAGVEIIGDMELLARSDLQAQSIGITGTNGKSTTTALVGHLIAKAGRAVEVGGNLGVPVLDLEALDSAGCYVLEMSSYQLDLTTTLDFDVAVLLNISPDHLDRHGDMAGYIAAKKRIFSGCGTAIVGVDDDHSRDLYQALMNESETNVIGVSGETAVPGGIYVEHGVLYDDTAGDCRTVFVMNALPALPGVHNAQNAAAAYAVARSIGLPSEEIVAGMRSFPGLAHRQELLAIIDGIAYVNDSKATNDEAAARALACYGDVYWIAGGRSKASGLKATRPYWDRVRHAYLIGEAANDFARTLDKEVANTVSGQLSKAVGEARQSALAETGEGAVVLLSPACASFDQFDNFEARGNAFRDLVDALEGERREAGA